MNKQVKPADIIIMVSGAVAIIFSFMAWFAAPDGSGGDDISGWGEGIFPIGTYIGLIGLAMGVLVALTLFANVNLPEQVAGFTWNQLYLAASAFATLLALGYLIIDKGPYDAGIGMWLSILAAIGLLVGAIMRHMEGDQGPVGPGGQPPTPF